MKTKKEKEKEKENCGNKPLKHRPLSRDGRQDWYIHPWNTLAARSYPRELAFKASATAFITFQHSVLCQVRRTNQLRKLNLLRSKEEIQHEAAGIRQWSPT